MNRKMNRGLIGVLILGMLVLAMASVQVVGAIGEVIWYWKDTNVSGFTLPSEDHLFDKFMNTSEAPEENINYTVTVGRNESVWWYANYPAECNLTFPAGDENKPWVVSYWAQAFGDAGGHPIYARLYVIHSNGSATMVDERYNTLAPASGLTKKERELYPGAIDVDAEERIAIQIEWYKTAGEGDALKIYYNSTTYNSTLTSPPDSPAYPVPELSTLILFSTGLLALAGYVLLTKRRR